MPTRKPDDRINAIYRTIRDSRAQEQQAGMQPMRQAGGPQRYLTPSDTLAQYRALGTTADRKYQAGRGPIGVNVEARPGSAFTKRRMGRSSDEKMADRMAMIDQARSGIPATDMGRARYGSTAEGRDITTGREIGRGRGYGGRGSGGGNAADDIYNSIRIAKEYQLYQNAMASGRPDDVARATKRWQGQKAMLDAKMAEQKYNNPNPQTPAEAYKAESEAVSAGYKAREAEDKYNTYDPADVQDLMGMAQGREDKKQQEVQTRRTNLINAVAGEAEGPVRDRISQAMGSAVTLGMVADENVEKVLLQFYEYQKLSRKERKQEDPKGEIEKKFRSIGLLD